MWGWNWNFIINWIENWIDLATLNPKIFAQLGAVIHKLAARAMIDDYVNGVMDEDQRLHEVRSMNDENTKK